MLAGIQQTVACVYSQMGVIHVNRWADMGCGPSLSLTRERSGEGSLLGNAERFAT